MCIHYISIIPHLQSFSNRPRVFRQRRVVPGRLLAAPAEAQPGRQAEHRAALLVGKATCRTLNDVQRWIHGVYILIVFNYSGIYLTIVVYFRYLAAKADHILWEFQDPKMEVR